MFTDFAMDIPLLLSLYSNYVFEIEEFLIEECLAKSSSDCERTVHFLASVFHLSFRCNKMLLKNKTLLRWYSGVLVLAREGFPRVFVFLKRESMYP
jgi:hypothetical protein